MTTVEHFEIAVVGGGIAGASAAWALAQQGHQVVVVEREGSMTAHSTGRSAAQFLLSYSGPVNRALSAASQPFLENDADGWADHRLLVPRAVLWAATDDGDEQLDAIAAANQSIDSACERLDGNGARALCPALDPSWVRGGVVEYGGFDIDVAELHQAFIRSARSANAMLKRHSGVRRLTRRGTGWELETSGSVIRSKIVVNAAGAWADEIAEMAGAERLGLTPYRRTIFTFASSYDSENWPLVVGADESFYFKPEGAGQLLGSPADEHAEMPCNAKPREFDIAAGIEAINQATLLEIRSIRSAWAGLRTFSPDRDPVVGFDRDVAGFFWCAGQGGTGIQTSPAVAWLTALLISPESTGRSDLGSLAPMVSPERFTVAPRPSRPHSHEHN